MNFIEILKYIFLGIVQGFTEILPISSSGHLVLAQELLHLSEPGLRFEIFTNTASMFALILLFHQDLFRLIKHAFLFVFKKDKDAYKEDFLYLMKIIIAIIPIGIVGFIFRNHMGSIKGLLTVGISLMVTGIGLLYIYFTRNATKEHSDISFKDALCIGFFQMVAIFPGISRSGSTLVGGRISHLKIKSILKFSFLCYIFISIPTSLLGIYDLATTQDSIHFGLYLIAFLTTFLTTFITAKLVMKKLHITHMLYFGLYCLIIGLISFGLYFI